MEWKRKSWQNVYTDNMTSFLTTFVLHHFQIYIFSFLQRKLAIIRFQVRKQVLHHGHKVDLTFVFEIQREQLQRKTHPSRNGQTVFLFRRIAKNVIFDRRQNSTRWQGGYTQEAFLIQCVFLIEVSMNILFCSTRRLKRTLA